MRNYILKKIALGFLLIFCVSFLIFSMLYMMPGDPVSIMAGQLSKGNNLDELRHEYGLDRPFLVQFFDWLRKVIFYQDFGLSYKYRIDAWSLIKTRIPISLRLTVSTLIIQNLIAVPLGLYCAYHKDTLIERGTVCMTLLFTALPTFWLAVIMMLIFAVNLHWVPLSGFESFQNYILPVVVGVISGLASTIRLTKSEVLDAMNDKYVTTAYAKGLSRRTVMFKHVLRNSLIVITTNLFLSFPWLISGYIVIEKIFGIPGMGNLLVNSIIQQDFNVIQAIVFIITVLTVICNILSDIVLGMLDPRIRISVTGGDR